MTDNNLSKSQKYSKLYYSTLEGKISRIINNARKRCRYEYAHRGIKMNLSRDDIKYLWHRDKAYSLKSPSLDRIDNNGHYVLDNCQFIELCENITKDKIRYRVAQRDSNGNTIAIFESCKKAGKSTGISPNHISQVAAGVFYSAGGYFWDRVDENGNLLFPDMKREKGSNCKAIIQMDMDGRFIKEWPSKREAAKSIGIDGTAISKAAHGARKSAGGYKWKYIQ